MREVFDIPLPGPGANDDAMEEYCSYLPPIGWTEDVPVPAVESPYISGYMGSSPTHLIIRERSEYVGFDIRNENQSVTVGAPLGIFEVLRGRFDFDMTDRRLRVCAETVIGCETPATEDYRGVTLYIWGRDSEANHQKVLGPPAFDKFGRGGRIAVQENYVFRTIETPGMKEMIDAGLNRRRSLADVEEFQLLANGMNELGPYTMFLSDETLGFEETAKTVFEDRKWADQGQLRQELEGEPMLRHYQAFATGAGKDDHGAYTALVLVHADQGSAEENVERLLLRIEQGRSWYYPTPWSVDFDIGRMEVRSEGRLLLAKLRPLESQIPEWIDWVFHRDPLLLHE